MSKIKNVNTKPELILRRLVWAAGLRYRLNHKVDGVRPDFIFLKDKLAIFVDGCFWHRCPLHCVIPKTNKKFWEDKLARNIQRDITSVEKLRSLGWTVLRFWEHQVEKEAENCAYQIAATLRSIRRDKICHGNRI